MNVDLVDLVRGGEQATSLLLLENPTDGYLDDSFSASSYSPSESSRLDRIEKRLRVVEEKVESLMSDQRGILVGERKSKTPRVGRDRAYWAKLHPGMQRGSW